jgi:hypothetical protein
MAKFISLPIVTAEMLETARVVRFNDLKQGDFFLFGFDLCNVYNRRVCQKKLNTTRFLCQENSKSKPVIDSFWKKRRSNYEYVIQIELVDSTTF